MNGHEPTSNLKKVLKSIYSNVGFLGTSTSDVNFHDEEIFALLLIVQG